MKRAASTLTLILSIGCSAAPPPAATPCAAQVVVSSPAPKAAPPVESPPTRFSADPTLAACGAAVDLAWLDDVKMLRLASTGHGHFGLSETHVDLESVYGDPKYRGIVVVSWRGWHHEPLFETKEIIVEHADVDALVTVLREGVTAPKTEADEKAYVIGDMSRSEVITLDLSSRRESNDHRPPRHVQFVVDEGETSPFPWRMRTCAKPFTHEAREAGMKAYQAFLKRLDVPAMFDRLKAKQAKLPQRKPVL